MRMNGSLKGSIADMRWNLWKLGMYLRKEETLTKKCGLDQGDAVPIKRIFIDINERLSVEKALLQSNAESSLFTKLSLQFAHIFNYFLSILRVSYILK